MVAEQDFVHLHTHSEYSLLDGAIRVTDLPRLAKEMGHTAVALTDHGNMYGAVAFYRACIAEGVRPIIGCEIYVAPKSRYLKTADRESNYYHLVLLVENETGYKNLIALVSRAYTEGFYGKPRADAELLAMYSEGLICLTGCMGGYIPSLLLRGDYEEARNYAEWLRDVYGESSVFLEMQDHGIARQKEINRALRQLSAETGIPLVVTNDAHYPRRTDADTQAILMCIQTNSSMEDGRPIGFETDEFFYKSAAELSDLFWREEEQQAMRNTKCIADRCHFDFSFDRLYLPVYRTPDGTESASYLRRLALEGFEEKLALGTLIPTPEHPADEYRARIDYELRVICETGYAEYYLIVWDFVHYAKSVGIPVGPGRGSGAGSLIAYLIGITDVDSIRYSLMFERFLNPERVSMPDFDIDFCDTRRGEVIDYVRRKYGEDHVAQIVTYGTLAARAAVRDVGRALGMPYSEVDTVAKAIPQDLHITLSRALENTELRTMYDESPQIRRLIDTARALEGMPRHASTHAAGVVITDRPVSEYVPLAENSGMPVTQFDMDTVAALGLLKIDFLGLRYLTVIADAEEMIRLHTPDFRVSDIPIDDEATYAMIARGQTLGVFQLESGGMRNMLTQLAPENLEMIVAAISLYRPGPMDSIPKFLENRRSPDRIVYPTAKLAPILDVTFGVIVYQEQVMQICREIAGYTFGRADVVRRAMAKKKTDVMERERQAFIFGQTDESGTVINTGALASGMTEKSAGALFDEMAGFAKYAFNKAHASAYAVTTYRTAYLKRHYPAEYFSALLTSVNGNLNKTAEYVAEAQKQHIAILAPSINESTEYFRAVSHTTPHGKQSGIRFGLLGVRGVGIQFVKRIIEERADKPFADFEDFAARMADKECSKRQVEALIKCGAFDELPQQRSQLIACYEAIIDSYTERARASVTGQLDLFSAFSEEASQTRNTRPLQGYSYPAIPEFSAREKLILEREATGQCFSGHLLDDYMRHLEQLHPTEIGEILSSFESVGEEGDVHLTETVGGYRDKQSVSIAGIISKRVAKITKKGDSMAFVTLEDRYAEMEVVIFPKVLETCASYLTHDTAIFVSGTLSVREEESPKLLAKVVLPLHTNDTVTAGPPAAAETTAARQNAPDSTVTPAPHHRRLSDTPIPPTAKTLYLRLNSVSPTDLVYAHAENLSHIFSAVGNGIAVVFYEESTGIYHRGRVPAVALTPYVLGKYESLLGRENVILK
ncbi:MAG: DNA polymerase III subunit alpha [Clostridia bacterium]|nr:DNA polymerase III subunit alpha [Clostridia bacterium]